MNDDHVLHYDKGVMNTFQPKFWQEFMETDLFYEDVLTPRRHNIYVELSENVVFFPMITREIADF